MISVLSSQSFRMHLHARPESLLFWKKNRKVLIPRTPSLMSEVKSTSITFVSATFRTKNWLKISTCMQNQASVSQSSDQLAVEKQPLSTCWCDSMMWPAVQSRLMVTRSMKFPVILCVAALAWCFRTPGSKTALSAKISTSVSQMQPMKKLSKRPDVLTAGNLSAVFQMAWTHA